MGNADDKRPLLLLDGMSLAFRAFYALSVDIQTSSGLVTNALHGFASMLTSLLKTQQPRALAVAFDLPGGTFRDAMVEDYKGGRGETPPEIEHQFDLIRSLCEVLHIPVLGVPSFEADDVLATLATWGRDNHMPVVVVTGDRDSFQLVEDPYIRVLYNKRGVSDYDLYDEAGIFERCGVEPARYPLLAAMRGDSSDNLPGVPGVGEKTAAKLLAQYRDFDEIYANLDSLTPKLRENLALFEDRARNNERVMRLVRDVPLEFTPADIHLGGWSIDEVHGFFDRFEMQHMKSRYDRLIKDGLLGSAGGSAPAPATSEPKRATRKKTTPTPAPIEQVLGETAVAVWAGSRIALFDVATSKYAIGAMESMLPTLCSWPIRGHDIKELFRRSEAMGLRQMSPGDDSAIMAYLVDSTSGKYDLDACTARILERESPQGGETLFDVELADETLLARASDVGELLEVLNVQMTSLALDDLYRNIELPLVRVLGRMEARGICVDRNLLRVTAEEFADEAKQLDTRIQELAGHSFKVNSPAQMQVVLFEELRLTPGKKTKTGFSTDASTLESIVHEHEIVPLILRFREVDKLRSTYGESLIGAVADDGRIHATFNQMVARTGRLSSENPNLHNIPVRSADGKRLRHAFGPQAGWQLAVSDYNQIELRILAHLSGDEGLLRAFASGSDVHRAIAAIVYSIAPQDVTSQQREFAKAVSYGLAYGMEAYGLSQRLQISVGEAKSIMQQYFGGFPSLHDYMERTVSEIRARGYSRTEMGRIRPFPDLQTASGPQRAAAERQAMNAGIQGLAADIFKSALVRLDAALEASSLEARLVLQVHDEVLVEAPASEREAVEALMREALTGAASLRVPLDVSLHWGSNWAVAKG